MQEDSHPLSRDSEAQEIYYQNDPIEDVRSQKPASLTRSHASGRDYGRQESTLGIIFSKLSWLIAAGFVFVGAWYLGPGIVQRYEYAATKGKIQAEYETASIALRDQPLRDLSIAYQMVAGVIRPSVVHIDTGSSDVIVDPHTQNQYRYDSEGQGSGVIMSEDGHILTNEHVVANAETINVTLSDRRTFPAVIVGLDKQTDLALLKINATDLKPAQWGSSDDLNVGSLVWAVGSPFGLEQSITSGIISAKHRRTRENPYQDLLQSDAAVNPGNSGGPLVDSHGRVIGINTSIVGPAYQGISFSVPSTVARDIYERLKVDNRVVRGFLGVKPIAVSHELKQRLGLPSLEGAFIEHVTNGTPAARSGIRRGDVILSWNGKSIVNDILLFREVGMTRVNTTANVAVWRDGREEMLRVQVSERVEE